MNNYLKLVEAKKWLAARGKFVSASYLRRICKTGLLSSRQTVLGYEVSESELLSYMQKPRAKSGPKIRAK